MMSEQTFTLRLEVHVARRNHNFDVETIAGCKSVQTNQQRRSRSHEAIPGCSGRLQGAGQATGGSKQRRRRRIDALRSGGHSLAFGRREALPFFTRLRSRNPDPRYTSVCLVISPTLREPSPLARKAIRPPAWRSIVNQPNSGAASSLGYGMRNALRVRDRLRLAQWLDAARRRGSEWWQRCWRARRSQRKLSNRRWRFRRWSPDRLRSSCRQRHALS